MLNDNLLTYLNTFSDNVKLESINFENYFSSLPLKYQENTYDNPYSNLSFGIADGDGFIDQLILKKEKLIKSDDKRIYVKNWLMQNEHLTDYLASALTGVWYAESRLNPSIHEIGKESNPFAGKGIAQWTGRLRLKHAEDIYKQLYGKSKEIKQMTLEEQLNVAVTEFKERTSNWNKFINSKNINEATDIVWRGYENGGNNSLATMLLMNKIYRSNALKLWNERIRFANEIHKLQ